MAKKKTPFNQNAAQRGAWRRLFARSPIVREVLMAHRREVPKYNKDGSRAKKDAVQYECNVCKKWTSSTAVAVDHIVPVISVDEGFIDWNTFSDRLFCGADNLQVICDTCHNIKTQQERFERAFKQESEYLNAIACGKVSTEDQKKWLKKFTAKKLLKYPEDFVNKINALKKSLKK